MTAGKTVGYIRVSSEEQNPESQLEGLKLDKVFIDKVSGKDMQRANLNALISYVCEGDIVIVHSMDRLARNLGDLRRLVYELMGKSVKIQFVKENLIFSGDDSPMANLLLSVMGAFVEFERALIRERQLEGITLAKKRGAYRGRKRSLTNDQVKDLQLRASSGEQKSQIARDFGISRETLYQYLKIAH